MTLAELLTTLERVAAELPIAELPDLIGALATTSARAELRLRTPPPPAAPRDDVVDVATLSAELGLAPSWLRAQARANKLPHLRCGKYIKFRRADVLEAISREGGDHKMGSLGNAEKRSNGKGSFPSVFKLRGATDGD